MRTFNNNLMNIWAQGITMEKRFSFLISIYNFHSGLCHQGAFKLPSGKWLCVVNDEIKKGFEEGQQYCENNGFDRLFEVRSLEDSQFTNKLEFCEYKK